MSTKNIRDAVMLAHGLPLTLEGSKILSDALVEVDAIEKAARTMSGTTLDIAASIEALELMERIAKESTP